MDDCAAVPTAREIESSEANEKTNLQEANTKNRTLALYIDRGVSSSLQGYKIGEMQC